MGADSKVELFRGRRLFMVPKGRLTDAKVEKLNSLSKLYPKTGRAYSIVAALDCCCACHSMEDAEKTFDGLCSWMRCCRLQPMKDAALTLKSYKDKILAYFYHRNLRRDKLHDSGGEEEGSRIQHL